MARRGNEPEFNFDQDIVDIIPERYDQDPDARRTRPRRSGLMSLGLCAALLLGLGAFGLYFFGGNSSNPTAQGGLPMIKAEQGPLKTRPDDRGGMEVPNQDKLVYERLGAASSEPKVERLLPPPEAPQAPPSSAPRIAMEPLPTAPPAPPPAMAAPAPQAPAQSGVPPVARPAAPPAEAPQAAANPPAAALPRPGQPLTASPPTASPPAPAPQAASPATAPKPAAAPRAGDYVVQLAALRSRADAEKTWTQINKSNGDLLSSLRSDIVQVDLGQKGIFFRLRAGPMDEASAKSLCGQLTQRKVGCLVAKK